MMGTHNHLTAAPRHLAHHHQLLEKPHLLEIHPLRRCLEIHLTRQFHQFHHRLIRTLGRVYLQQGGLYHQVINLRQGPLYRRVLL